MTPKFPASFVWGAASASYQLEGAWKEDGRLPSVWDTFSHTPGLVHNNDTGDVSTDHYHRYREDVALMKAMGLKAYRFSISWSRVMDARTGEPNPLGIDFYNRLIDELIAAGIQPWITCFHWDLPQSLEDDFGGWRSRTTAERFADYCTLLARTYSDRVEHWFTINEFWNFTDAGYLWGCKAPGLKIPGTEIWNVRINALLAHGLGVKALRAAAVRPIRIGVAEAFQASIPVLPDAAGIEAARCSTRDSLFLRPLLEGKFSPWDERHIAKAGIAFSDADRAIISQPLDFVGLNVYAPKYVRPADNERGYAEVPFAKDHPHIGPEWLRPDPDILYWAPRLLKEVWNIDQVYISENGCAGTEEPDANGEVLDTHRLMYLRTHLEAAERAVAESWPLRGYFHWSVMDNFEWTDGYQHRFGLIHVDYKTLKRTPKLSAAFYRSIIQQS